MFHNQNGGYLRNGEYPTYFLCQFCRCNAMSMTNMREHLAFHFEEQNKNRQVFQYICKICQKKAMDLSEFKDHINTRNFKDFHRTAGVMVLKEDDISCLPVTIEDATQFRLFLNTYHTPCTKSGRPLVPMQLNDGCKTPQREGTPKSAVNTPSYHEGPSTFAFEEEEQVFEEDAGKKSPGRDDGGGRGAGLMTRSAFQSARNYGESRYRPQTRNNANNGGSRTPNGDGARTPNNDGSRTPSHRIYGARYEGTKTPNNNGAKTPNGDGSRTPDNRSYSGRYDGNRTPNHDGEDRSRTPNRTPNRSRANSRSRTRSGTCNYSSLPIAAEIHKNYTPATHDQRFKIRGEGIQYRKNCNGPDEMFSGSKSPGFEENESELQDIQRKKSAQRVENRKTVKVPTSQNRQALLISTETAKPVDRRELNRNRSTSVVRDLHERVDAVIPENISMPASDTPGPNLRSRKASATRQLSSTTAAPPPPPPPRQPPPSSSPDGPTDPRLRRSRSEAPPSTVKVSNLVSTSNQEVPPPAVHQNPQLDGPQPGIASVGLAAPTQSVAAPSASSAPAPVPAPNSTSMFGDLTATLDPDVAEMLKKAVKMANRASSDLAQTNQDEHRAKFVNTFVPVTAPRPRAPSQAPPPAPPPPTLPQAPPPPPPGNPPIPGIGTSYNTVPTNAPPTMIQTYPFPPPPFVQYYSQMSGFVPQSVPPSPPINYYTHSQPGPSQPTQVFGGAPQFQNHQFQQFQHHQQYQQYQQQQQQQMMMNGQNPMFQQQNQMPNQNLGFAKFSNQAAAPDHFRNRNRQQQQPRQASQLNRPVNLVQPQSNTSQSQSNTGQTNRPPLLDAPPGNLPGPSDRNEQRDADIHVDIKPDKAKLDAKFNNTHTGKKLMRRSKVTNQRQRSPESDESDSEEEEVADRSLLKRAASSENQAEEEQQYGKKKMPEAQPKRGRPRKGEMGYRLSPDSTTFTSYRRRRQNSYSHSGSD